MSHTFRAYLGKDAVLKRNKLRNQHLLTICRHSPSNPYCRHDLIPMEHEVYTAKVLQLNATTEPVNVPPGGTGLSHVPSISPNSPSKEPSWTPTSGGLSEIETNALSPYDTTNYTSQSSLMPSRVTWNAPVDSEIGSSFEPSISINHDDYPISPYANGISDSSDYNVIEQSFMPSAAPSVLTIVTHSMIPVAISSNEPSVTPKIKDIPLTPSLRPTSSNPLSPSQPLNGIRSLPPYAYPVLACIVVTLIALAGYCWARQRRTMQTSLLDETRPRKLYLHPFDTSTATFTVAHLNKDEHWLPVDEVDFTDCIDCSLRSSISMNL
jgi:hypothetical protein